MAKSDHSQLPEPWRHPPPFVTPLSRPGLQSALMLMRKAWNQEDFDEVLRATGCLDSEVLKILSDEEQVNHTRNAMAKWYRPIVELDTLHNGLERLANERAKLAGYSPSVLWSKIGTAAAFQCLAETVHVLGSSVIADGVEESPEHTPLRIACDLLATLGRVDCWTLYGWASGDFGPRLVHHEGLRYPEAVAGSASLAGGLVHRSLRRAPEAFSPLTVVEVDGDPEGTFARRECIATCWAVHLLSRQEPFVLFLNWRAQVATAMVEAKPLRLLKDWRSEGLPIGSRKEDVQRHAERPQAQEFRDLVMAARYCRGWLPLEPALPQQRRPWQPAVDPEQLQREVVGLFERWLNPHLGRRGKPRFGQDVRPGNIVHSLLREFQDASAETYEYVAETGALKIGRVQGLRDWQGTSLSSDTVILQCEPGSLLVQEGGTLLGQSIAWRSSILLQHIPPKPPGEGADRAMDPASNSLLRRRIWGRFESCSELAVPVFAGKTPLGGISIEARHSSTLGPEHVPWLESLSLSLGALFEVASSGGSDERTMLHEKFLKGAGAPDGPESVWQVLTDWAIHLTGADAAFVSIAGAAHASRRARAMAVSEAFVQRMQRTGLPGREIGTVRVRKEMICGEIARVSMALQSVLRSPFSEDALFEVFATAKPRSWRVDDLPSTAPKAFRLFGGITATPIRPHESLAHSAVLWVLLAPDSGERSSQEGKEQKKVQTSILRVGRVVASLAVPYSIAV